MALSVRISKHEEILIKDYAKLNNISVSELIRKAVIEKIEDEIDLDSYNKSMNKFKSDTKTYTIDEVEKELGL